MNKIDQTNPISEVLESAAQGPCILCQRPAAMAGSFTPDIAEQFGAGPGKCRVMFYGLCEVCARSPDFEAIEECLWYMLTNEELTIH